MGWYICLHLVCGHVIRMLVYGLHRLCLGIYDLGSSFYLDTLDLVIGDLNSTKF